MIQQISETFFKNTSKQTSAQFLLTLNQPSRVQIPIKLRLNPNIAQFASSLNGTKSTIRGTFIVAIIVPTASYIAMPIYIRMLLHMNVQDLTNHTQ